MNVGLDTKRHSILCFRVFRVFRGSSLLRILGLHSQNGTPVSHFWIVSAKKTGKEVIRDVCARLFSIRSEHGFRQIEHAAGQRGVFDRLLTT